MAGAVAQTPKENSASGSATTIASGSLGSNVTAGNKLWVVVNAGTNVTITPSQNSGTASIGSFTSLGSVQEAAVLDKLEHFVADVTGSGSLDILITYGSSTDRRGVLVVEVSGVSGADVNDEETSTGANPSPDPPMSVSVTAQPAFGLAFATFYQGGTPAAGSGWTSYASYWSGVSNALLQTRVISATGSLTADFGNASLDRSNHAMVVFTDGSSAAPARAEYGPRSFQRTLLSM